jgi:hypothetical protein
MNEFSHSLTKRGIFPVTEPLPKIRCWIEEIDLARIIHSELRSNGKNKTRLVLEFSYGLCN